MILQECGPDSFGKRAKVYEKIYLILNFNDIIFREIIMDGCMGTFKITGLPDMGIKVPTFFTLINN
jgi:hypothetical protein